MSRINEMSDLSGQDDIVRPSLPPDHIASDDKKPRGDFYSRLIMTLSAILAIAAVIASAIGFFGFAENDTGVWHLVTAFLLCFGIGALAYLPLAIIFILAKRAIWIPLTRTSAILVACLVLPWLPFAYYLNRIGEPMTFFSVGIVVTVLFILGWALRFLRQI